MEPSHRRLLPSFLPSAAMSATSQAHVDRLAGRREMSEAIRSRARHVDLIGDVIGRSNVTGVAYVETG